MQNFGRQVCSYKRVRSYSKASFTTGASSVGGKERGKEGRGFIRDMQRVHQGGVERRSEGVIWSVDMQSVR